MDVDLSTDLAALLPLVAPLISGHSDLAIGSRLSRGSRVARGAKREISRVDIVTTSVADLKGIARLARALGTGRLPLGRLREQLGRQPLHTPVAGVPAGMTGQLLRFAGIGVASTVAYLLLYAVLRTAAAPQLANLLALLVTAVANTAANRRLTFGVRGTGRVWRHQVQGLVIFALGLGLTSGSLAALGAVRAQPPRAAELAVLIVANLAATVLRFLLLRVWVFRVGQDSHRDLRRGTAAAQARPAGLVHPTRSPAVSTVSLATVSLATVSLATVSLATVSGDTAAIRIDDLAVAGWQQRAASPRRAPESPPAETEARIVPERTAQWPVWGTTARLVVTDPARLRTARRLVAHHLAAVDKAGSRFRSNSEVRRLLRAAGRPVRVSPLLAELVTAALRAARLSDGDVDPTLGTAMQRLGHDRDLSFLPACGGWFEVPERSAPGWHNVRLDGRDLTVPAGVLLDLGATAKAYAADQSVNLVAERCGVGVLVSLGGDIATAGTAPDGGWRVLVRDRPDEPATTVTLPGGTALATSSTISREWQQSGRRPHHILDPRTCRPVRPVWRTVSVAASRCADANTFSTAAVVRGDAAPTWLASLGVPARLVTADRQVLTLGQWPAEAKQ